MKEKRFKALVKQLEKHRNAIGKERDALRKIQSEIEDFLEPTNSGLECLESAISYFSEQA